MYRSEKGSVTIEATISLSAFMFAIVTFLVMINVCVAQAKIGIAINTTAREISQYSYLYGLTGFNETKEGLAKSSQIAKDEINTALDGINDTFNSMQSINGTMNSTNINDPEKVADAFGSAAGDAKSIGSSVSGLSAQIQNIASDPKSLIFGFARLAASDALDYATSRYVAAPISKALVQKHLTNYTGQSPEEFLKQLGVVPAGNGSYLDGLDFTGSTLFLYGSDDIRIVVKYKIKIIPLLPIKSTYSFVQTAAAKGWLCGDEILPKSEDDAMLEEMKKEGTNESMWLTYSVSERSELVRKLALMDLKDNGYSNVSGLTQIQAYNPETGDFVLIASSNPLYTAPGSPPKTVEDIDEANLIAMYERLAAEMNSDLDRRDEVTYKNEGGVQTTVTLDGSETKTVQLVIPNDPGLQEKMQQVLDTCNTNGVNIVLIPSFGSGAGNEPAAPEED